MLDKELKNQSLEWAAEVVKKWVAASDPANPLSGEDLDLFKEYQEWGLGVSSIKDVEQRYTIVSLAMRKYGKLKWAKDNPPKPKLSKWEVVHGKAKRK